MGYVFLFLLMLIRSEHFAYKGLNHFVNRVMHVIYVSQFHCFELLFRMSGIRIDAKQEREEGIPFAACFAQSAAPRFTSLPSLLRSLLTVSFIYFTR